MTCDYSNGVCINCGESERTASRCKAYSTLKEISDVISGNVPTRAIKVTAFQFNKLFGRNASPATLSDDEIREIFPDADPTLMGNRIAALTTAIGIPPCGGCNKRKKWLNKAHAWLKALASGS